MSLPVCTLDGWATNIGANDESVGEGVGVEVEVGVGVGVGTDVTTEKILLLAET